jgi:N-succinyldiaminopimelate aminotransferase
MPRHPKSAPGALAMPGAVYSPFADRIADHPGPIFPLHVGDTWMEPFVGGRMEDLRSADHPDLHRYGDTRGIPELVDALVEKLRTQNGLQAEPDSVLVTGGATSGLACVVGSIVEPGEEVLILAPFWPLIRGIVQAFRGVPVEVPFYDRVDSAAAAVEAVRARCSKRTVALYVSTPSNPTGVVIPEDWLAALADFARENDLWLLSDEVYEDFVYRGRHVSIGTMAPERTVSLYSFSKAYGMAGYRVGYLTGPTEVVYEARKIGTHTSYHAPIPGQLAGLCALREGAAWVESARAAYREAAQQASRVLGLQMPGGSTFLFLDVSHRLDERGMLGFLSDCFADGVLVAPGASSGEAYGNWIRLCYTAAPPDQVREAVTRLARRL